MRLLIGALVAFGLSPASAHDGVVHKTPAEAAAHSAAPRAVAPVPAGLPFPVDIDVRFALTDQTGRRVTEQDFRGRPMAVFFGYANCQAICSVALPRLGEALDLLGERADAIAPLLITVDPVRDTPETMGPALAKWHPALGGLTGSEADLAAVRARFQVEAEVVYVDPDIGPVYSHGSFIYLIGAEGDLLTIVPPILGPERIAQIISAYL